MAVLRLNYELPAARRKGAFTWSLIMHVVAGLALLAIVRWMPSPTIESQESRVTLLYTPPPVETAPVPKVEPPPPTVLAKLVPPRPVRPPEPAKIEPPKIEVNKVFAPKIPEPVKPKLEPKVVTGTFVSNAPSPVRPKEKEIVKDSFASGSSAPVTLQKPAREVQTGGFGDPNGVKGNSEAKATLRVASLGSFGSATGPGEGNGTGGARGAKGYIASAGFGDGVAGPGQGDRRRSGSVAQAGFSEMQAAAPTNKVRTNDKPALTPVEIVYKPLPVYTQEARQLRLEGEVLVRVTFAASGQLQVQEVVRGLGHGLDESALRAARQIKFRPARRNGEPYDSVALVHIVFELAQ